MVNIIIGINGIGFELTSCLKKNGVIKCILESKKGNVLTVQLEMEKAKVRREDMIGWLREKNLLNDDAVKILDELSLKTFYVDPESTIVKKTMEI